MKTTVKITIALLALIIDSCWYWVFTCLSPTRDLNPFNWDDTFRNLYFFFTILLLIAAHIVYTGIKNAQDK